MTLVIRSSAINSVAQHKAATSAFREKDAVCIEARALQGKTIIKPVQPPSFPYFFPDIQIAAQQLRQHATAPTASAHKVALSYQRHNIMVRTGAYEVRA